MKYETLIPNEKEKWFELEVTIGTNETIIAQELARFKKFLLGFNDTQQLQFKTITSVTVTENDPLDLHDKPILLRAFLLKKFIDQHGLQVIYEARNDLPPSEEDVFLNLLDELLTNNKYPEDIYAYAVFRQRGTPNTWLKIIGDYTADEVQERFDNKIRSLTSFLNINLRLSRRFRFKQTVGDLRIYIFSKPLGPKVFKGESKNFEVPRASFTFIVFDRAKMRIGVVTGSKNEVQVTQRFFRKHLLPDSIGFPRSDINYDGKELLKKMLQSDMGIQIQGVSFERTLLGSNPLMKLKVQGNDSLDDALDTLSPYWTDLKISDLKSVDYLLQGKLITAYVYGDDWNRTFINVSGKRKSSQLEETMLTNLEQRIGAQVKESRFIVEELSSEFIIEKLLNLKTIASYPPLPREVEKTIVELVRRRFILKPTKLVKRRCENCYGFSWDTWLCPTCDRESMLVVGEMIKIKTQEKTIIKELSDSLKQGLTHKQVTLYPYKRRRNYKKSVIRVYNPHKNTSVFLLVITSQKDITFAEDLLNEGFGIVAFVDPDMSGKQDTLLNLGCDILPLHKLISYLLIPSSLEFIKQSIYNQEQRILERIYANLKRSLDRLKSKPSDYNEDIFEIDIKNLMQSLVPDVVRLGTEYKGKPVPDGYCCYGYRNVPKRKKKMLFGWDAKYSFSSSYSLHSKDLTKQRGYIKWLTKPGNEPTLFGRLGIYAFVSNFANTKGFEKILTQLATSPSFPKNVRLVLLEDLLLVNVCEWLLEHWQKVIENNSEIADTVFKWFRRKTKKPYNTLSIADWNILKSKLDRVINN